MMPAPPGSDRLHPCIAFSQLAPCPLAWLWLAILPRGKLVLLEGDPRLGKSLLTLDLCARLTTGRPWPDGAPSPGPANVLILCAEDGLTDTVLPRVRSLPADLERVFTLCPEDPDAATPLSFPAHIDLLDAALERTLRRVKKELNIQTLFVFLDGHRLGYWLLPGQSLPEFIPSSAIPRRHPRR